MIRFSVTGMTCGHCAGAVKKAVQSAAPGAEVRVDLATGTVETSEGNAAAIKAAIEEAGYTVEGQAA